MTGVLAPLPVWPTPRDVDKQAIIRALDRLRPPFPVEIVEAHPGSPGGIVGLGVAPGFLCDHMVATDEDSLYDAVWWALSDAREDSRSVSLLDMLDRIMPGTVEITDYLHSMEVRA
jgi:hypothetical protein